MKILVVEDDKDALEIILLVLRDKGFNCDSSMNGAEALEMLKENEYDLLIVDSVLPGLSGPEIVIKYRDLERDQDRKKLKIVGLSAVKQEESWRSGHDAGFDVYLTKPISKNNLLAVIDNLS